MRKKVLTTMLVTALAASMLVGCGSSSSNKSETAEATTEAAQADYKPVTITLNLDRSGLGENVEYTFKKKPTKVVADGDQMADMFFDLGLADDMAGYTEGACIDTVKEYPGEDKVPQLAEPGINMKDVSKETVLATGADFLVGWDSLFAEKAFNLDFCKKNGIVPYFPYVCSDKATFDDLYKDYETLGQIFQVEDTANQKVQAMKDKLESVKSTLGDEAYQNPVKVFVYDSGEDAPFTACQGMPGDILKHAGAESIFSDINKGWATPSWEQVVNRDPDVILVLEYSEGDFEEKKKFLETNKYTKDLRAVKEGKIYNANCAIMQGSAGSADLVETIAKQIYPDKF
ncbi:MAG: ABC transporter substrate-binding protein [Lachnospiraceae bacterium]|nr:ABC transporter substrate-binding protein [Lachnospiraceae bacterium]